MQEGLLVRLQGRWVGIVWLEHHWQIVISKFITKVLAPPCTFVVVKKRVCGGPPIRTLSSHPPRVSLRCLLSALTLNKTGNMKQA